MAKVIALLLFLSVAALAQDRVPPSRRTTTLSPQLTVITDTDHAAGFIQTSYGYPLALTGDLIPASSTVGIFGQYLTSNSTSKVSLWSDNGVQVVDATVWQYPFFGLEVLIFRLPVDLHGNVYVTTLGRQASNTVKITVE